MLSVREPLDDSQIGLLITILDAKDSIISKIQNKKYILEEAQALNDVLIRAFANKPHDVSIEKIAQFIQQIIFEARKTKQLFIEQALVPANSLYLPVSDDEFKVTSNDIDVFALTTLNEPDGNPCYVYDSFSHLIIDYGRNENIDLLIRIGVYGLLPQEEEQFSQGILNYLQQQTKVAKQASTDNIWNDNISRYYLLNQNGLIEEDLQKVIQFIQSISVRNFGLSLLHHIKQARTQDKSSALIANSIYPVRAAEKNDNQPQERSEKRYGM